MKHRLVEFCVAILTICGARAVIAGPVNSAPPLPAPSGAVVNVATEAQLQSAVSAAAPNTTIVIAPGIYNLTGPVYVNNKSNLVIVGPRTIGTTWYWLEKACPTPACHSASGRTALA